MDRQLLHIISERDIGKRSFIYGRGNILFPRIPKWQDVGSYVYANDIGVVKIETPSERELRLLIDIIEQGNLPDIQARARARRIHYSA